MTLDPFGWRAHVIPEPWGDTARIILFRHVGEHTEVVNSDWSLERIQRNAALPADLGIRIPWGAWEAVIDFAAPSADAGEVKALRDALELERLRVDRVLDAHIEGARADA